MSRFTAAFERLLDAQEGALGARPTITIGAVDDIDVISHEVGRDIGFIDGGTGNTQTFEIQVRASDFSGVLPAKHTTVVFTPPGMATELTLETLDDGKSNNGVFYLLIGDSNGRD